MNLRPLTSTTTHLILYISKERKEVAAIQSEICMQDKTGIMNLDFTKLTLFWHNIMVLQIDIYPDIIFRDNFPDIIFPDIWGLELMHLHQLHIIMLLLLLLLRKLQSMVLVWGIVPWSCASLLGNRRGSIDR